jgi:hypothetical protein
MVHMIGLKFYIPSWAENLPETKEIGDLLEEVKNTLNIDHEKLISNEKMEQDLKRDVLWSLSVFNRIKIKQSRRGKSLYPQLVVFVNDKAASFYPQERVKEGITIKDFLTGLLNGEVKCLHDKRIIGDELRT